MKYRSKLKLKLFALQLLGIATILAIFVLGYLQDKLLETILSVVCFCIFKPMFEKQWHASSLYNCSLISIIVFVLMARVTFDISASIFVTIMLTFVLTCASYTIRNLLDEVILLKSYQKKLEAFSHKALENLTEAEMCDAVPSVPKEIVHIVYGYLHKPKTISSTAYAMKHYISEATLFRYLKRVRTAYEDLE